MTVIKTGICTLPKETLAQIAQNLNDHVSVVNLMLTCTALYNRLSCDAVWKPLFLAKFDAFELLPVGSRRPKRKASVSSIDLEDTVWFTKYRSRQSLIKQINDGTKQSDEAMLSQIVVAFKETLLDDQNAWQLKTMETFFRECRDIAELMYSVFYEKESKKDAIRDEIAFYSEVFLLYYMFRCRTMPKRAVDTYFMVVEWLDLCAAEIGQNTSEMPRSLVALSVFAEFSNDYFEYECSADNIDGSYIGVHTMFNTHSDAENYLLHVELKLSESNMLVGNGHENLGEFELNGTYNPSTRHLNLVKNFPKYSMSPEEYNGEFLRCGVIAGNYGPRQYGRVFVLVKKDKLKLIDPASTHFRFQRREAKYAGSSDGESSEDSDSSDVEAGDSNVED